MQGAGTTPDYTVTKDGYYLSTINKQLEVQSTSHCNLATRIKQRDTGSSTNNPTADAKGTSTTEVNTHCY
jgi:hypothetical protein